MFISTCIKDLSFVSGIQENVKNIARKQAPRKKISLYFLSQDVNGFIFLNHQIKEKEKAVLIDFQ